MNTQELSIPLSKLVQWDENVRGQEPKVKAGGLTMDELTASIRSVGLLHNLVVQKARAGKFMVIAGGRRLTALGRLAEEGAIKKNEPVRCFMAEGDPIEIGLAENVVREPMHPAAQFEAFRALIDKGHAVADISARFGVAESLVVKRLALARVSPKLLAEYRGGAMNLEQLQAFTLSDNHKLQERVWKDLPTFNHGASQIRRMLSQNSIVATDKRAQFVTVEAYEKAGGPVRRDLFSENDDEGVFLLDEPLLNKLVSEQLESLAAMLRTEGWSWVEVDPNWDYQSHSKFKRVQAQALPLRRSTQERLDRLQQELAALYQSDVEETDESEQKPIHKLEMEIRRIEESRKLVYSPEVMAAGGAIVTVGGQGEPMVIRGLVLLKDEKKLASPGTASVGQDKRPSSSAYSAALIENLSTNKTAAVAVELALNPKVALASAVYSLLLGEFSMEQRVYRVANCLQLSATRPRMDASAGSPAGAALDQAREAVLAQLPAESANLWPWCLAQDQDRLLSLLAFCMSRTVNGIVTKLEGKERADHANALASALNLDVAKWFTPTAANFFNRVSRQVILDCLTAAGKPPTPETLKLKKGELAAFAESEVAGTGWLPDPMLLTEAKQEGK